MRPTTEEFATMNATEDTLQETDVVEEASEASFPASDPPSWTPVMGEGHAAKADQPETAPRRQGVRNQVRTILHPTDFSDNSAQAFEFACSLAQVYRARLILLHVAEPTTVPAFDAPGAPRIDNADKRREELIRLRPPYPDVAFEHQLVTAGGGPEIVRLAENSLCDLIVMGTNGRTGLHRLLMGSVAEHVLRNAPCPVLTVKNHDAAGD